MHAEAVQAEPNKDQRSKHSAAVGERMKVQAQLSHTLKVVHGYL